MTYILNFRKKSQVVTSLCLNGVLISLLIGICAYGGMVMFAFYHDCDPIKTGQVSTKDQMFPMFVMQMVGDVPGVPGLFVAGVFSGALSSVSSGLNSLAAVFLNDFLNVSSCCQMSERAKTITSKLVTILFGVISFAIVFLVAYLPGVLFAAIR